MSHTKGLAEIGKIPSSNGGSVRVLFVSNFGIAVMCVKVGGEKVEEANARRIAALWNMAERLGLSTEDIEGITDSASLHNLSLEVMAKERGDSK